MDPFWMRENWQEQDKHLKMLRLGSFQRAFEPIKLDPGLYTIRGPRQIGKSTWMKKLLLQAIEESSPDQCFFYSCENLKDFRELAEIIQIYKSCSYLFFDEITFVKEWSRPIKHLIDSGYPGVIVLSGSHTMDLRAGNDRMPGREGSGREINLLPMDFREFKEVHAQANWPLESHQIALQKYFITGGFPIAVQEAGCEGIFPKKSMSVLRKWVLGDLEKSNRQSEYGQDILAQVGMTMGSQISLNKLAQRTQVGSHHTVNEYLKQFEDMFILKKIYSVDNNSGAFRFKKEVKIYFLDPLYFALALSFLAFDVGKEHEAPIAESVAASHLIRRYPRVGFLYSKKLGEIDFYSFRKWALEIKWTDSIPSLSDQYVQLVSPKKMVWRKSNFLLEWP